MQDKAPTIIDIEASGFGTGSYPVEIGIVLSDGSAHCYLIRPYDDWTHWEAETEKLHRLSRETADRFGMDGGYVAGQLNQYLEGQKVYSDAWEHASQLLETLFERAGVSQKFTLEQLAEITSDDQQPLWESTLDHITRELGLKRHRASADARIIQATWLRTLPVDKAASS